MNVNFQIRICCLFYIFSKMCSTNGENEKKKNHANFNNAIIIIRTSLMQNYFPISDEFCFTTQGK